jgi:hypothetical protein
MNTGERVRAAQNPQDALCMIADALDALYVEIAELKDQPAQDDGWGSWESGSGLQVEHDLDAGESTVTVPAVSEEVQELRRKFAESTLNLQAALEAEGLDPTEDWVEAYAKGGPLWLYHGNRDFVVQLPYAVRHALVLEASADDPEEAIKMGRDLLKDDGAEGYDTVLDRVQPRQA